MNALEAFIYVFSECCEYWSMPKLRTLALSGVALPLAGELLAAALARRTIGRIALGALLQVGTLGSLLTLVLVIRIVGVPC